MFVAQLKKFHDALTIFILEIFILDTDKKGTFANSEDPDEMAHKAKMKTIQGQKYILL